MFSSGVISDVSPLVGKNITAILSQVMPASYDADRKEILYGRTAPIHEQTEGVYSGEPGDYFHGLRWKKSISESSYAVYGRYYKIWDIRWDSESRDQSFVQYNTMRAMIKHAKRLGSSSLTTCISTACWEEIAKDGYKMSVLQGRNEFGHGVTISW